MLSSAAGSAATPSFSGKMCAKFLPLRDFMSPGRRFRNSWMTVIPSSMLSGASPWRASFFFRFENIGSRAFNVTKPASKQLQCATAACHSRFEPQQRSNCETAPSRAPQLLRCRRTKTTVGAFLSACQQRLRLGRAAAADPPSSLLLCLSNPECTKNLFFQIPNDYEDRSSLAGPIFKFSRSKLLLQKCSV